MAIYTYPEFKKASKKHLIACECLIDSLDKGYCSQNKNHILTTIYYLSGYVFETILKFSLYSALNFDKNTNITGLNVDSFTYNSNIKTHSLSNLKRDAESKNISLAPQYEVNKNLFLQWNSEMRYIETTSFSEEKIRSFFEFAKQTYITLQSHK